MLGLLLLLVVVGCAVAVRFAWRRAEPSRRRPVLLASVLVVLALVSLPFDVWLAHVVSCGHRPIETSDFAAANSYTLPSDGTYTWYPIFSGYACDLAEVRGRQHDTLP